MERSVIRHSAGRHLFFIISADSGFEHLKNIIFIRWWTTCPISTEDALHDYVINMYFNKEIIFKNQKSQAIATIRHLQKIDLFAKTRAECQVHAGVFVVVTRKILKSRPPNRNLDNHSTALNRHRALVAERYSASLVMTRSRVQVPPEAC